MALNTVIVKCKGVMLVAALILACIWCQHVESLPIRSSATEGNTMNGDDAFSKLSGNWLNIPSYSNFKIQVQSRADTRVNMIINGFIKKNEATTANSRRNPYQIFSKTSMFHSTVNATHYFDSQMEHYNSEQATSSGKPSMNADQYRVEYSNFRIPFHQMLNQAYENNAYLYSPNQSKYQIFDNAIDTICKDSELVVTFFHEQYFLLCLEKTQSRTISSLKHIVGREFIATFKSFIHSTFEESIEQFKLETHKFPKKRLNATALYGTDEGHERGLMEMNADPRRAYFFRSDSHACLLPWLKGSKCATVLPTLGRSLRQIPKKRCVFIHGYGTNSEFAGSPVFHSSHFRDGDYWGKIDEYTPQCSERVYMREETNFRGWINRELQQSVCRLLSPNGNETVIRNTIIFAHSMGNMMVGGAIANGYCSLDLKSTSWYNIMGPVQGTPVANAGAALCNPHLGLIDKVVSYFGLCDKETGEPSEALYSLSTKCSELDQIKSVVEKNVQGYMCGISRIGLNSLSPISIGLNLVGSTFLVNHWDNDGVVPFYSCRNSLPKSAFSKDYESNNYMVKVNHKDGTCANGDGWFDSSSPCSFYLNKY